MLDKYLIFTIALIFYICVCLISVAVVLNDPKAPLSSNTYYKTNEDIVQARTGGDIFSNYLKRNPSSTDIGKTIKNRETEIKRSTEAVDFSNQRTDILATKPMSTWAGALPMNDFNQLIDLHNFQYIVTQSVCSNHIKALILIHSAPQNFEKRKFIRDTWGSIINHSWNSPLRVIFLFGAVESEQLQDELLAENSKYKDIIQGSFTDKYRNMTYKHVMAFKWYLYNCPQAQILLKVDDDVYLNTPQLLKYLRQQKQHRNPNDARTTLKSSPNSEDKLLKALDASRILFNHPQNLLFCDEVIGARVRRSYRSKWRTSFRDYSDYHYPSYCSGYVLIYSADVVFRLYNAAQNSKYFWIDDVHITGILAHKTKTTITNARPYILYIDKCDQLLSGKTDLNDLEFLFASYEVSEQQIKSLWDLQTKVNWTI